MKFPHVTLVLAGLVLTVATVGCNRKPKLDTDKAKVSYAIGQNIAQNIKAQNIDLDPKVVAFSIEQGMKGDKPELTPEAQQQAIINFQKEAQAKSMADAEKNQGVAKEFLEKNKSKEGVKVTDTGLQYEVLKTGPGKKPKLDSKVTVHYTGTLVSGQKFDSSHDRGQPAEFQLKGVIKGWQEALQLMPEGSVYRLYIPPDLAYGPQAQPGIPANSVLVFDVELIKVAR